MNCRCNCVRISFVIHKTTQCVPAVYAIFLLLLGGYSFIDAVGFVSLYFQRIWVESVVEQICSRKPIVQAIQMSDDQKEEISVA